MSDLMLYHVTQERNLGSQRENSRDIHNDVSAISRQQKLAYLNSVQDCEIPHSPMVGNHPNYKIKLLPAASSDTESTYSGNSSTSSGSNNSGGSSTHGSTIHRGHGKGHSCTSPRMPSSSGLSRLRLQSGANDKEEPSSPTDGDAAHTSSAWMKRKRPPKLEIPVSSCFSSPANFVHVVDLNEEALQDISEEGLYYGIASKRGRRDVLEDTYRAIPDVGGNSQKAFFGIFDGHGGRKAAEFSASELGPNILNAMAVAQEQGGCMKAAVREGYLQTDRDFLKQEVCSGASCVTAVAEGGILYIANAGDCRAVLSRGGLAEALTSDHRASRDDERERIQKLGGMVDRHSGIWRVQGVLAVSRGIGDIDHKDFISAEPDVYHVPLSPDCDFLILASDGLWDVVSNQEAVDVAMPFMGVKSGRPLDPPPSEAAGLSEKVEDCSDVLLGQGCNLGFGYWATTPKRRSSFPQVALQRTPRQKTSGFTKSTSASASGSCSGNPCPSPARPTTPEAALVPAVIAISHTDEAHPTPADSLTESQPTPGSSPGNESRGDVDKGKAPALDRPRHMSDSDSLSRESREAQEEDTPQQQSDDDGEEVDFCIGLLDFEKEVPRLESPLPAIGPVAACRKLVEFSAKNGSHDDVSVMVISLSHFLARHRLSELSAETSAERSQAMQQGNAGNDDFMEPTAREEVPDERDSTSVEAASTCVLKVTASGDSTLLPSLEDSFVGRSGRIPPLHQAHSPSHSYVPTVSSQQESSTSNHPRDPIVSLHASANQLPGGHPVETLQTPRHGHVPRPQKGRPPLATKSL